MLTLVWMDKDREHTVLLLNLLLAGFMAYLKYVKRVNEAVVQKLIKLVLLSKLIVLAT